MTCCFTPLDGGGGGAGGGEGEEEEGVDGGDKADK